MRISDLMAILNDSELNSNEVEAESIIRIFFPDLEAANFENSDSDADFENSDSDSDFESSDSDVEINLNDLTDDQIENLKNAFSGSDIKMLDLNGVVINAQEFINLLKIFPHLEEIDLSEQTPEINLNDLTDEAIAEFATIAKNLIRLDPNTNPRIIEILNNNNIRAQQFELLNRLISQLNAELFSPSDHLTQASILRIVFPNLVEADFENPDLRINFNDLTGDQIENLKNAFSGSDIKMLDLNGYVINAQGFINLIKIFPKLKILDLSEQDPKINLNDLTDEEITELKNAASESKIEGLYLHGNAIDAQGLIKLLKIFPHLKELSLGWQTPKINFNDLTDEEITELKNALSKSKIKELHLEDNAINAQGLIKLLKICPQLEELDLWEQHPKINLNDLTALQIRDFQNAFPKSNIKKLNFNNNEIDAQELINLFKICPYLEVLSLDNPDLKINFFNNLENEEIIDLKNALSKSKIKELHLGGNAINTEGLINLLKIFPHLEELYIWKQSPAINFNNLKNEEIIDLKNAVSESNIKKLDLSWNAINAKGFINLLKIFPQLEELDMVEQSPAINFNDLTALQIIDFQNTFSKSNIKRLNLEGNAINAQGLIKLLKICPHLEELDIGRQVPEINLNDLTDEEITELAAISKNLIRLDPNTNPRVNEILNDNKTKAKQSLERLLTTENIRTIEDQKLFTKLFEEESLPRISLILSIIEDPERYDFIENKEEAKNTQKIVDNMLNTIPLMKLPGEMIKKIGSFSGDPEIYFGLMFFSYFPEYIKNQTIKRADARVVDVLKTQEIGPYKLQNLPSEFLIKALKTCYEEYSSQPNLLKEFSQKLLAAEIIKHPKINEIFNGIPKLKEYYSFSKSFDMQRAQSRLLSDNRFKQIDEAQAILDSANGDLKGKIKIVFDNQKANGFKLQILNKEKFESSRATSLADNNNLILGYIANLIENPNQTDQPDINHNSDASRPDGSPKRLKMAIPDEINHNSDASRPSHNPKRLRMVIPDEITPSKTLEDFLQELQGLEDKDMTKYKANKFVNSV